ncbi:hypothetical protein EJD97_016017 [Solanum chilense]|uniref:Uncharacterized protein n=1 Tax=Solanum chilense TaxID=4083 RepID=A0A6N2B5W8_SOLCI|nr:hypothetical protein EJD97_016017 [Solanum chilense]
MPTTTNTTPRYGQKATTFSTPIFTLSSTMPYHSSFGSLSLHDQKGVPFSWEHIPGIPKQQSSRKNSSSLSQLLPLPPPSRKPPNSSNKIQRLCDEFSPRKISSTTSEGFKKDPFFAALVECSKDHHEHHENFSDMWKNTTTSSSKVMNSSRRTSLSDKFGFMNMYASCKRTCTVSESVVYLPRSRNYDLLRTRRTSQ